MSPECITDCPHDGKASDVYDLGLLLFHMLIGKLPFEIPSTFDILKEQINKGIKDNIPNDLPSIPKNLILAMTETDYKKRITLKEVISNIWFQ